MPITDTSNDLPAVGGGDIQGISPQAMPVWQMVYSAFGPDLANGYEARPTTINNNFKPDLWEWVGLPDMGGADDWSWYAGGGNGLANGSVLTAPVLNIRYPGQYHDAESGLSQNWWRSYDARMGRYTQNDPIGLAGGMNRFNYVDGDGVNGFDPNGLAGKIPKNFGRGKSFDPVPDPRVTFKHAKERAEDFNAWMMCGFGFNNCDAEQGIRDAYECVTSDCVTAEGNKFSLDADTCSAYDPATTQCQCTLKRIRRGGNPNDNGRLPGY